MAFGQARRLKRGQGEGKQEKEGIKVKEGEYCPKALIEWMKARDENEENDLRRRRRSKARKRTRRRRKRRQPPREKDEKRVKRCVKRALFIVVS